MPHIDLSTVVGIAGGMIGICVYLRTASIKSLQLEVESLRRQFLDLDTRCKTIEEQRDQARAEIVAHYTARMDLVAENRTLHQKMEERDEQLIKAQASLVELQKNVLAKC